MGKVILVPPPVRLSIPVPQDSSKFQGMMRSHPVQFMNSGDGMSGMVMIQDPKEDMVMIDPMFTYGDYYGLNGSYGGSRVSSRIHQSSAMIHSMEATQVVHAFWDHRDLEEQIESFIGDVLVQIDNQSREWSRRWNFSVLDMRDSQALQMMMGRRKNHRIEVHEEFRDECIKWMRENCTEYDYFDKSFKPMHDTYYIRDDTEAIHFKMKWYGMEPEPKEEMA